MSQLELHIFVGKWNIDYVFGPVQKQEFSMRIITAVYTRAGKKLCTLFILQFINMKLGLYYAQHLFYVTSLLMNALGPMVNKHTCFFSK